MSLFGKCNEEKVQIFAFKCREEKSRAVRQINTQVKYRYLKKNISISLLAQVSQDQYRYRSIRVKGLIVRKNCSDKIKKKYNI